LIKKFQIDSQQLSYLSAIYLYACVLCVIPAGLLIDRFGVRKPLLAAVFLNVVGASLFALTNDGVVE
ncbi:MAG: MFS transporter, partial [Pirellula sp.]|nr:MFS transporter [Pirellula sp.]